MIIISGLNEYINYVALSITINNNREVYYMYNNANIVRVPSNHSIINGSIIIHVNEDFSNINRQFNISFTDDYKQLVRNLYGVIFNTMIVNAETVELSFIAERIGPWLPIKEYCNLLCIDNVLSALM